MELFRIVKDEERAKDLSGNGAFTYGGRWNSEGIFALYTSEHSALAFLELLVHLNESEIPETMYIITLSIPDNLPMYKLPLSDVPQDWRIVDHIGLKEIGDTILKSNKYIALQVPSAVLPTTYNYILNPQFPHFQQLVQLCSTEKVEIDKRLSSNKIIP